MRIFIFSVCASMYMTYLCAIDKATHIRMHHTQRSSLAWQQGASATLRQRQGRRKARDPKKTTKKNEDIHHISAQYLHNICTYSPTNRAI